MKKGTFYRDDNIIFQYLGKVEHYDTGEILAVLKLFKQGKTFVMSHYYFEELVKCGDFKEEGVI